MKPFFYLTKKAGQKRKYLKNKKSFKYEIKSIFCHKELSFKQTKTTFLEGQSPTLSNLQNHIKWFKTEFLPFERIYLNSI